MKTTFIYSLCDPDTLQVRYVGKTDNIYKRYWRHIHDESKTYKTCWIKNLKSQGKLPIIQIIEEVDITMWPEAEKKWINHYKSIIGNKLTNFLEGGTGGGGMKNHVHSKETIEKMSKSHLGKKLRPHTDEERKKISEANKNPSEEIRKKISNALKGHSTSIETRRKLSEKFKGRPIGIETRRKISGKNKGRILSAEIRKKISENSKKQWANIESRNKMMKARENRREKK
jgi:hypothetical protein